MKLNLQASDLISQVGLVNLWQQLDVPLVILFSDPSEPLCQRAKTYLEHAAEYLHKEEVYFLVLNFEKDQVEFLIDEYKVTRIPTVMFFDYGKELARLDLTETITVSSLTKMVRRLLANEL